jgi:hypothetical protein
LLFGDLVSNAVLVYRDFDLGRMVRVS